MHYLHDHLHYNILDRVLIDMLDTARRLSQDGTWQDCAETNEPEALRYLADLIELRSQVLRLQKQYLDANTWTPVTDNDVVCIVRRGEQVT